MKEQNNISKENLELCIKYNIPVYYLNMLYKIEKISFTNLLFWTRRYNDYGCEAKVVDKGVLGQCLCSYINNKENVHLSYISILEIYPSYKVALKEKLFLKSQKRKKERQHKKERRKIKKQIRVSNKN